MTHFSRKRDLENFFYLKIILLRIFLEKNYKLSKDNYLFIYYTFKINFALPKMKPWTS